VEVLARIHLAHSGALVEFLLDRVHPEPGTLGQMHEASSLFGKFNSHMFPDHLIHQRTPANANTNVNATKR
jgi:hypothetical protein